MAAQPLISVIIPVYNAQDTLRRALDSILGQTYRNLEIILVDDGSTDGSGAICDACAAADGRVRVLHQANAGVAAARNAGLGAVTGDYICWLDSDDAYHPTAIEKLYGALSACGKSIAICNYTNIQPDGSSKRRYKIDFGLKAFSREDLMGFMLGNLVPSGAWCNLIARELYPGIHYPDGRVFEDVATTYKLFERGDGAAVLSEALLDRYIREGGISALPTIRNRAEGCLAYIARCEDVMPRWPKYRRAALRAAARQLCVLRGRVLSNDRAEFEANRADVEAICAYFREHAAEVLPEDAPLMFRLEYHFMTAGTRRGFALSRVVDHLARKPESFLWGVKIPDMPAY